MKRILAFCIGAMLAFPVAAAQSPPPPALCSVVIATKPSFLPGFYSVKVSLKPSCSATAVADVRLESYVGGRYPRVGFFRVTKVQPLERSGVPWYWRVGWRGASGEVSPLILPNTRRP